MFSVVSIIAIFGISNAILFYSYAIFFFLMSINRSLAVCLCICNALLICIIFSPAYARRGGNQRPNSKYRPNCWTEDPNDQPPPIPDYENENINSRRRRRKRQVPCLWELQEHIWGLENDDY